MDSHQNSHWERRSDAVGDGFSQQQGGLPGVPAAQQHQGWLAAPSGIQQQQQQQQQPRMRVAAGSDWGGGGNSAGNQTNQTFLDDAIDRFGVMTLRDDNNGGVGGGVMVEHRGSGGLGDVDGLDMGSLQVAKKEVGAGYAGFGQQQQHQQRNPFSGSGNQQQQQHVQQQPQQQQQGFTGFPSPTTAPAPATVALAPTERGVGGCCPSCGGGGGQQRSAEDGCGRRGPDGAWLDHEGRRLYTEAEVREAIEQELRGWRDKATSLEGSLANMEGEAKAALRRAEQAIAEMAEQLKAAEGKTYALSVHLAQSNRPSHLA